MPRDLVVLINRTSKDLSYRYDGIDEILTPGENPGIPRNHVFYAKDQNKRMGSENFYNPKDYVCLVAVKGTKDDATPIEQSDALQVINREDKNERDGQVSESRRAAGPTAFDAKMPGSDEGEVSSAYMGSAGDGRPSGAARPRAAARPAARQAARSGARR